MITSIIRLHLFGWGTLIAMVVGGHPSVGATTFGVGMGLTAYMLGVRHAFDADHIAAIDNTTRKLMRQPKRPVSVGFWFSCGHSTVVFMLTVLLAFGVQAIAASVLDGASNLHAITGLIGTLVSNGFLYEIAALNIAVLADIWSVCRRMRLGQYDEVTLERQLESRGLMQRLIGYAAIVVTKPRHMYVVGLLFGLGFDTATAIGLLVLATSGAASGLPWYAVLCLPVLFAAGMSLFDTLQGLLMTAVYGWALAHPIRKIYYNLVVTGLSVAVALVIGTLEVMGLLGEQLKLRGAGAWASALDLNMIGFLVAGLFIATWLVAAAIWKYGRVEERWTPSLERAAADHPSKRQSDTGFSHHRSLIPARATMQE